ncbi:MAG TPA: redox-sensing transcriptional repressor Rex [Clostridia bacterium]|nr:redox-sensing transcriptional repressor Rex [Clostridia bacterium]
MRRIRIPDATIRRLPIYLRVLRELEDDDVAVISSADLAVRTGFSSEQIRKDLAYFGAFGVRGVGYSVSQLEDQLRRILGLDKEVRAALVGAGNLGTALTRYNVNRHKDVKIVAIFDNDPAKVGKTIEGVRVYPVEDIADIIRENEIKMGIITTPASSAEKVAELLVRAGIRAILNFAPVKLGSTDAVAVRNIDLTLEFESLAYYAAGEEKRPETS